MCSLCKVVSALGTVLGLMTALLPLRCQPLNFFIFTTFRAAAFSAFSNFGARAFGPDATGSLLGIIFFVGGVRQPPSRMGVALRQRAARW